MRKLCSLIMALVMTLGLACARAEDAQDNFLISDWKLLYSYGDSAIAEQTVFIYEDKTFEVMQDDASKKGAWTFDGETLTLSADDEAISLKWNEEAHRFTGEYNGMTVTLYMSIEPEGRDKPADSAAEAPSGGMLAGGWTVADDPAITDDINNLFFRALESYQTGTITIAYSPVALLGTQVVAGTNYAVLSKASEINKGSKWVILYLYQDLEGNAAVLDIADVSLDR